MISRTEQKVPQVNYMLSRPVPPRPLFLSPRQRIEKGPQLMATNRKHLPQLDGDRICLACSAAY